MPRTRRGSWPRCRRTMRGSRRKRGKLRAELVPPIDGLWKDLENDLNAIATQEQWERHGRLAIGKPGRALVDSETMDRWCRGLTWPLGPV